MANPFAKALHDYWFDEQRGPLRYRDGEESEDHEVAGYFDVADVDGGFVDRVDGPLLDMGAGAGRQALAFQRSVETVAIEPTALLVEVLEDRGVDARSVDMFSLREAFDRDAFGGAFSAGTQVGIAGSLPDLREFLGDLAYVTAPDAVAKFDGYDPDHDRTRELIGFRAAPSMRGAHRIVQYEYDGELGEPWLFRLFTPAEIREAVVGTGWEVASLDHPDGKWSHTYNVELRKR